MAPKQDDGPGPDDVGHSFLVTHVMRPPGSLGGGAQVSTGHLNAHEAMDWIRGVLKDHKLGLKDPVDPTYGVHPDVVAQLLPADPPPGDPPATAPVAAEAAPVAEEPPEGQ